MSIIKRQNKVAFKKGTDWGDAVEPSTGDQLHVETNSPPAGEREQITSAEEYGEGLESQLCMGPYPEQSGSFAGKLYVSQDKIMEIIASIFGSYGGTPDTPQIGALTNVFVLQRILSTDIFHTIAHDEGSQVKAVDSAKFNSFAIALDGSYKHTTNYIGNIYGVKSLFATPMVVTGDPRIACFLNENTTVRINAQSAAALSSADDQDVTSYSFTAERGYTSVPVTAGTAAISDVIDNTQPMLTVVLEYPKKTAQNEDHLTEYQAGTIYKMSIAMTGPNIVGVTPDTPYQFTINLPGVYITTTAVDQETPEPTSTTFTVQYDSGNVAGMSYNVPYIEWINDLTALTGYPAITET